MVLLIRVNWKSQLLNIFWTKGTSAKLNKSLSWVPVLPWGTGGRRAVLWVSAYSKVAPRFLRRHFWVVGDWYLSGTRKVFTAASFQRRRSGVCHQVLSGASRAVSCGSHELSQAFEENGDFHPREADLSWLEITQLCASLSVCVFWGWRMGYEGWKLSQRTPIVRVCPHHRARKGILWVNIQGETRNGTKLGHTSVDLSFQAHSVRELCSAKCVLSCFSDFFQQAVRLDAAPSYNQDSEAF